MPLHLRQIIVETLDESDSPDPHVVAEDVLNRIGPRDVRAALADLLADEVRRVIHQQRGTAPLPAPPESNGKRDLGEMARDPWRHRQWVPGSGWKFLGDLTADDCDAVADHYEVLAEANAAQARRWRTRARWLRTQEAVVLRDLGAEVLEAVA